MGSKLTGPASLSCVLTSLSTTNPTRYSSVHPYHFRCALLMSKGTSPIRKKVVHVVSEAQSEVNELGLDPLELEDHQQTAEAPFTATNFTYQLQGTDGKPGFISFYNRSYKLEDKVPMSMVQRKYSNLLCSAGPAILVASFVFPSLYLRRILSAIFEDSLLTDFLILFFTEALFYCGVGLFLLIIDYLKRPVEPESSTSTDQTLAPNLIQQISSIATLVLSLIVPMFTMGLVWPWIGPAASATLAPYLVGIIVQFAFERYARYRKSPSWTVIPIIFQVYRLHQLNRATQLVTALSFTVRGAEMTSHNLEIGNSLGTLLNVLQFLGVLCIWSMSSFLMKFFPSSTRISERS